MAIINDADLLIVQRGADNYTYSGAELKADITDIGGGGGVAGVTKINAGSNVSISPASGVGEVTISASGGSSSTPGLGTVCSVNPDASAHSVSFRGVTCGNNITASGKIEGAAGSKILQDGAFQSPVTYNVIPGGLPMYINSAGYFGSHSSFKRSNATNTSSLDTSNFITALKALTLYRAEQTIPNDQRQYQVDPDASSYSDFGLFIEDVESSIVKDILSNLDGGERRFNENHYSHFLFGVCKQQQQLIENLTTRIEQLEADHASAMNNMDDNNGSSTY